MQTKEDMLLRTQHAIPLISVFVFRLKTVVTGKYTRTFIASSVASVTYVEGHRRIRLSLFFLLLCHITSVECDNDIVDVAHSSGHKCEGEEFDFPTGFCRPICDDGYFTDGAFECVKDSGFENKNAECQGTARGMLKY